MAYNWNEKTILIAEDDHLSYRILKSYLRRTNAEVLWAEDGQKAIEVYNQRPNLDLIIMDIRMPVMNGFDAARIIRQHNQKLPILAHSAFAYDEFNGRCENAGCNAYIPKPSNMEEILNTAKKLMEGKKAEHIKAVHV